MCDVSNLVGREVLVNGKMRCVMCMMWQDVRKERDTEREKQKHCFFFKTLDL